MKLLPRIEEIILLAIWKLGDKAYGMAIREEVMEATGEKWLLGAIYGPLARLHQKDFIDSVTGEPTPERGGRAKVYYSLTDKGVQALARMQKVNSLIWKDIPNLN